MNNQTGTISFLPLYIFSNVNLVLCIRSTCTLRIALCFLYYIQCVFSLFLALFIISSSILFSSTIILLVSYVSLINSPSCKSLLLSENIMSFKVELGALELLPALLCRRQNFILCRSVYQDPLT